MLASVTVKLPDELITRSEATTRKTFWTLEMLIKAGLELHLNDIEKHGFACRRTKDGKIELWSGVFEDKVPDHIKASKAVASEEVALPKLSELTFYDAKRKWSKIKPHLKDEELNRVLVRDFNKFTYGRWRKKFLPGMKPFAFESCDWWLDHRGRKPAFWQYVKHSACHWLVNFNLRLAMLVEPNRKWRIVTSQKHSTVWDGERTLFDMNFLAFGCSPQEAWQLAYDETCIMKPGKYLKTYLAEHYKAESKREREEAAQQADAR